MRLLTSLRRFPEPLALAFCVVVILIINNHSITSYDARTKLAMTLALGIPLALCLRALGERKVFTNRTTVIGVYVAAIAVLFLYHQFLLPNLEMVAVSRFLAINLTLYLFFLAIPYLGQKDGFEYYVIKLFADFAGTFVYASVLYLGIVAIMATLDLLFAVTISSKLYLDLWLIVAGIFAPAYFLAGIPKPEEKGQYEVYNKFLQILLLYIVLPLLTAYSAILYAYFIKIIVTQTWPEGIVSHLVLWYSLFSTVVIFFIYPLKEENSWANIFIKYYPKLILPLLLMMFISMGIRINAYGVTENRYFVIVGGLWVTGSMFYFAVKKNTANIRIVLAAGLVALLAVFGPWSAYTLSKFSQNKQLEKILAKNDMLVDGTVVASHKVSLADQDRIGSILQYFASRHNLAEVWVLPADFDFEKMEETFGFKLTNDYLHAVYFHHYTRDGQPVLDVKGYDFYLSSNYRLQEGKIDFAPFRFVYGDNHIIQITRDGQKIYEKDLAQVALAIHAANMGQDMLDNEKMVFVDENEHVVIKLYFHNFSGRDLSAVESRIEWMEFSLLLKVK